MIGDRRSLVLITVDCFRADHAGFLGYERGITPFLDNLSQESTIFTNAIVAGTPTYYSLPAIMASRSPLALGRDVVGIAPREPTLASVLKREGYATGAFLAANPYLSARFGYEEGFDTFHDHLGSQSQTDTIQQTNGSRWRKLNRKLASMAQMSVRLRSAYDEMYFQYCQRIASAPAESFDQLRRFPSADLIVDEASAWLAERGQSPFFLWLHLMDAHSPYYPCDVALQDITGRPGDAWQARYLNSYWNRADLGSARLKRHREEVVNLYDAGIRWVDSQIARLVQNLRYVGDWDNCIFAVTADHGEEFLEHKGRYHSPSNLHEELIRVPLLLRTAGANASQSIDAPFSLIHLAPTLLAQLNISSPDSFQGNRHIFDRNLSPSHDESAVVECIAGCTNPFREEMRFGSRIIAVRGARFKLVINLGSGEEELFDLQSDPGEQTPIASNREIAVRRNLLKVARNHLQEARRMRGAGFRLSALVRDSRLEQGRPASRVSA